MPTPHHPPAAVRRVLRKLGADIHDARRRRRLPMAVVAERAFTSRSTLQKIEGGDTMNVGEIEIQFLHTPGHTPGSQCFLVNNRLVSGDTLFINACGRCDLPGGNAEQMYESLQRLGKLGDEVVLLPGHNYADQPTSTISREKRLNPYYQAHSLSDFLHSRMGY